METKYKTRTQIGTTGVEQDWDYNSYSLECESCGCNFNIKVVPGPDGQPVLKR